MFYKNKLNILEVMDVKETKDKIIIYFQKIKVLYKEIDKIKIKYSCKIIIH